MPVRMRTRASRSSGNIAPVEGPLNALRYPPTSITEAEKQGILAATLLRRGGEPPQTFAYGVEGNITEALGALADQANAFLSAAAVAIADVSCVDFDSMHAAISNLWVPVLHTVNPFFRLG